MNEYIKKEVLEKPASEILVSARLGICEYHKSGSCEQPKDSHCSNYNYETCCWYMLRKTDEVLDGEI